MGILCSIKRSQDPKCVNQKELKQNKISEMDGVYHHFIRVCVDIVLAYTCLLGQSSFAILIIWIAQRPVKGT